MWTGAVDGCWTNAANWAEGAVPGVVWDGTGTPGYPTGDVAQFGASPVTTIDCTGLYSISNVTITGAGAPAYAFTTTDADSTALSLEPGGQFYVAADVTHDQTVSVTALANLAPQKSEDAANHPTCWGTQAYFYNYSTHTVHFSRLDMVRRRPGYADAWQNSYLTFRGNGPFALDGPFGNFHGTFPDIYFYATTFNVNSSVTRLDHVYCYTDMTLNIAEGCTFGTNPTVNTPSLVIGGKKIVINGPGRLQIGFFNGAVTFDRQGYIEVNASGSLQLNCPLKVEPQKSTYTEAPLRLAKGGGPLTFNSTTNDILGPIELMWSFTGTAVFPSTNRLGTATGFLLGSTGNGATIRFDGADDESLVLPLVYTSGVRSVVRNGGTGTFTVASSLVATGKGTDATAEFCGAAGPIVFAPTFGDAVPKTFRFSGAAGVRLAAAHAPPSGSGLALADGTTLYLTDAATYAFDSLANVVGTNRVVVADGAQVTVGGCALTAGVLDFVFNPRKASVTFTGRTAADPCTGLRVNGEAAGFGTDGSLKQNPTQVDRTIAAKGDTVPDASGEKVGITAAGSGANTALAADAVALDTLVQQLDAPATIALADGQTLTANEVAIDAYAGDLTIGETAGAGTLAVTTLRNDERDSLLTVNAAIAGDAFTATGPGAKKIVLAGNRAAGAIDLAGGTVTVTGGVYEATGSDITVTNGARLVLCAGTGFVAPEGNPTEDSGTIQLGTQGSGVLQIDSGTVITNRIVTGKTTGEKDMVAGIYLRGGDVFPCVSTTSQGVNELFGRNGHTYYGIRGGTLTLRANVAIGNNNGGRYYGLITQTGGAVRDLGGGGSFRFAQGSICQADWYLCGGSFTSSRSINLGDWGGYNNYLAVLTVDGTGEVNVGTIQPAYWNGIAAREGVRVLLNVNGNGVVRANSISRNEFSYVIADARGDDRVYVNFDGGTFVAKAKDYTFGSVAKTSHVDRVTIHSRGMRFDTNGKTPEIAVPLQAPTGRGVARVVWNDELTGLVAPPAVKIVGSGEGASAHALLDEEHGTVTNIVITSRGWGYGPDTKAQIGYGHWNDTFEVPVALDDNVSGGLTVCGGGTLYLSVTNTYTGATCVTNATLALNVPDAISPASTLILEKGGKLNLRDKAQTFADIETRGGTVENGTPLVSGLTVDFAEAAAGRPKAVDMSVFAFTPDAALTLLNFDAQTLEQRRYLLATFANGTPALDLSDVASRLPADWMLRIIGSKLSLSPRRGTVLLFR